jgi:uncharacterized protein YdhG (YjbR/CyaY superfamily)
MILVMKEKTPSPISSYIQSFQGIVQRRLKTVYRLLSNTFPDASETFAYQMPTFKQSKNLIHFAGYQHHIGIYPGPEGVRYILTIMPKALTSKGTWRMPHDQPFPKKTFVSLCQWIKKKI